MWLPVLLLGYAQSAIVSRLTRSTMLDVLREDFICTARAKGLRESGVVVRHAERAARRHSRHHPTGHAARRALSSPGASFRPWSGRPVRADAIRNRDYPVVQAVIVLIATLYAVLNLLVDLVYGWIDPRIRLND
ncbi:MAG: ABC transporter permease [Dehalococcoidia bacterium]